MIVRPLIYELAEKARLELNEDPKQIESSILHIREWLAKQPHIKARTDNQWLLTFLRACKHSLERTKEKLDVYYSMRTLAPDFFHIKPTDTAFNEILEAGAILMLPKLPKLDGERIGIFRLGVMDSDKYKVTDVFSVSNIISRITLMEDDNTVVSGVRFIVDLDGFGMSFLLQMTPSLLRKIAIFTQEAEPMRFKGGHIINAGNGFERIFNALKPLLNEKTRSRMHVHNTNFEELYKIVPKEILPVEYGGTGGTISEIVDYWKKKINEHKNWLAEEEQFGSDESKRPGKPKSAEEMFGVDGSFRQLEFD